ncbi:hypothetical protein FJ970_00600 [Mesorhizobium sp. B2-1-8]|uniref:hypothetical protein n=1 Tax=unclassified Mesorhizobium TaxID=325217 RepID=UPI001125F3DE|nr:MULTISPECIES: hypothetical protein [unclassified Mesorhizobium]TPI30991.1 hypothetical protein FJW08_12795 [Mesorhizobium sp. B3-2-1]UCI19508.1 hypothetical protein FJ970_00600 [Mesorhizobium sp. B2-1-8]
MFLDGQLFSLGWTSRTYPWHKGLRQSIFLIFGIYASDPSGPNQRAATSLPDTLCHRIVMRCVIAAY